MAEPKLLSVGVVNAKFGERVKRNSHRRRHSNTAQDPSQHAVGIADHLSTELRQRRVISGKATRRPLNQEGSLLVIEE